MLFEFSTAHRIRFGSGTLKEVAPFARGLGQRALVVTGRNFGRAAPLLASLGAEDLECTPFAVPTEPTTSLVCEGAGRVRAERCELVIAIGGGSVLDAGKAIAALATNPGDLHDYLEVIGKARPLGQAPLPFIAIPTTAGTGAEVTRNAVLASSAHRVKASLRSPLLLARLAVVDPELTLGLPRALTASTGLDALTQLIEPFVSCRANPLVDSLCRESLGRVARALPRVCEQPADLAAREDMCLGSLCSGLALANAGLGAVHGFAAAIGGMFIAPHGAVCAALLPHVMEMNLRALHGRVSASPALDRYTEIARLLTGQDSATADDGVAWVRQLVNDLEIPSLATHGVTKEHVADLCAKAAQASSMKANPLPLLREELEEILNRAI